MDYLNTLRILIEEEVHGFSLFWGHDASAIQAAKASDLVVLSGVRSAAEARCAEEAGADTFVAQGCEVGGHVWRRVSTLALIPAMSDAVEIPALAAGGIMAAEAWRRL